MRDRKKKKKVKMSHCGWRMLLASCKVETIKVDQEKYRCRGERRQDDRVCEIMKRIREEVRRLEKGKQR